MTVTVNHAKTNAISDWTQAQLDEQIALGNFAPGTTLANIVLPSDWNDDHTLTGLGTMAEQDANNVAITGGSVNGTTIGATTASTGRFTSVTTPSVTATTTDLTLSAISTGVVNLNTLAGKAFAVTDHPFTAGGANVNFTRAFGGQTGYSTGIMAQGSDGTVVLAQSSKGATSVQFFTSSFGAQQFNISHTASAVNYVQVTGAATTGFPAISAQGSDTNIGITYAAKGSSRHVFTTGNGTQFRINDATSSVNTLETTGAATGLATRLYSQGSDTNISLALLSKGTGAIDLAAGSRGVNISNGGTVTAITRTAGGNSYTTAITGTISAPTTAGGVQATMSAGVGAITQAIAGGGTGYTVGNVLNVVGGTIINSSLQQIRVDAVSGGVITAISVAGFGQYTVLPTNPVSVTGGSGSGATFNLSNWSFTGSTITNAGSGYIEQPTVTFSGGGGSGAAAYAVIGNTTITRGLAAVSTFHLPSGEALRLSESSGTSVVGLNITNGSSNQNTVYMFPFGSATNPNTILGSKGTGFVGLFTGSNNDSNGIQQFRASHTASAVNYVQVTGGATGNSPVISAQGSDAAVALSFTSKSTNAIRFLSNNAANLQFRIVGTNAAVNNLAVTGTTAGNAPILSVEGSDTNIDLALTPKGTGLVRFGTYVAGALTATGYINIKAADGTTYKVLVST